MALNRWVYLAAGVAVACCANTTLAEEPKPVFKARGEVAFVKTSGNTDTQTLAAKLEASYEPDVNRYYGKAGALYGKTDGDETQNKWFLDGRYERALTDRLFAFAAAGYMRDKFSGYNYQTTLGPGVGYQFIKTEEHQLKGLVSIIWAYDRFSDGGSDSYAAGKAAADYTWQITKDVKFKELASYRVSFKDTNVYFIDSETGLEVKLASNLSLGVGYVVGYQHEPPSDDLKKTDTLFLTSLIVTF